MCTIDPFTQCVQCIFETLTFHRDVYPNSLFYVLKVNVNLKFKSKCEQSCIHVSFITYSVYVWFYDKQQIDFKFILTQNT